MLLGGTGTAGRATAMALRAAGHEVVAVTRTASRGALPPGIHARVADVTSAASLSEEAFRGERFDALVSCLTSRTGVPGDAWAVDYGAHMAALSAAELAGVPHMVLLSAICVQKPRLAFQHAKLAFEDKLIASGLAHSIVRPTAFFKSLSGQIERVRQGKPFLVFGDGRLTACAPISDADLGAYMAGCLTDPSRRNQILPIGGPGPAITPLDQAEALFGLLDKPMRVRHVPVALLDGIVGLSALLGRLSPVWADRAERARIGRFYATESMLALDPATGRYDRDATPATGSDTLFEFYEKVLRGDARVDLGEHAVF
ncbi:MAG: NAD(P)H-binding protein [Pseudomonadota bacterium]